MMRTASLLFSVVYSTLLLVAASIVLHGRVSKSMSTITAMAKDQIACNMCSGPPQPSPPPLIECPPPPSPPPVIECPPPPSPPPVIECPPPPSISPPPPGTPSNSPPPPENSPNCTSDCEPGYYPPPSPTIKAFPLSPNPMVPYFPFYYYSPPPPSSIMPSSITWRMRPTFSSLIISFVFYMNVNMVANIYM